MILLLSDDTWAKLVKVLHDSEDGLEIVRELSTPPVLPEDRELVRMARAGDPPPPAIERARLRRERAIDASTTTRAELAEMIRHVHGAGVPVVTLSRWFGLRPTRVYEIIGDGGS
jgi:hypothetical protein